MTKVTSDVATLPKPTGGADPAPARATAAPAAPAAPTVAPKAPAVKAAAAPKAAAAKADSKAGHVPPLGAEPQDDSVPALGAEPIDGDDAAEADAQPEGEAPKAGDAEGDEAGAAGDAPPIEYDLSVEEGRQPYPQGVLDAYTGVLQKHRVAPDVAKEIIDTVMPAVQQDVNERIAASVAATSEKWKAELVQRHGPQLKSLMNANNRWLRGTEAPQGLVKLFAESPALAWNPDIVDLLTFVRKRVANDRSVSSTRDQVAAMPKDPVKAMEQRYQNREAALEAEQKRG